MTTTATALPPVTAELGNWTASLRLAAIPPEVQEHAKLCLLDSIGCGLFGARQPWGRITADLAGRLSGGGPASLWGSEQTASVSDAALANGTAVHGFELDDAHVRGLIHPGSVTVPAVLALAQERGATGTQVLAAVIAGYEVGLRVGISAGHAHGTRGYHPTGTVGCLGAAAGAANLLGLTGEQTTHALAIGATQAAGLYAVRMGAMAKRMHAGRAAQSGVLAALLAEQGFTGAVDALEAPFGGFMSTMGDGQDLEQMTEGLGKRWETREVGFKVYAACASAHTTVDAIDRLLRRGLRLDDLRLLRVHMSDVAVQNVGWRFDPAGGIVGAQMNGSYAAAVKLLDGEAFIEQYSEERVADPRILELIERIEIRHDPAIDRGGMRDRHTVRVEAHRTDRSVWEETVTQRKGSPGNPITTAEVEQKFRQTAGAALPAAAIDELHHLVMELDRMERLDRFWQLLSGAETKGHA